jgi:hypothetical protein
VRGACLAFGVFSAFVSAGPAAAMNGPYEAATTRIQVRLVERLSAQTAKAGDVFRFDTTSSVMVAGRFFPAETHGHGVVLAARSGRGPQSGRLVLAARSLDPAGGEPVEVGLEPGQLNPTPGYEKGHPVLRRRPAAAVATSASRGNRIVRVGNS